MEALQFCRKRLCLVLAEILEVEQVAAKIAWRHMIVVEKIEELVRPCTGLHHHVRKMASDRPASDESDLHARKAGEFRNVARCDPLETADARRPALQTSLVLHQLPRPDEHLVG